MVVKKGNSKAIKFVTTIFITKITKKFGNFVNDRSYKYRHFNGNFNQLNYHTDCYTCTLKFLWSYLYIAVLLI